jgi:hypothetical protein
MIHTSELVGGYDLTAAFNQAPDGFNFRDDFDGNPVNFTAVQDVENAGTTHVQWFGGSELILGNNGSDLEDRVELDTDTAKLTFSKSDVVKSFNGDIISPFEQKDGSHTIEVIDQTLVETAKAPIDSLPTPQNFKYFNAHTVIETDAKEVVKNGVAETDYHTEAKTTVTAFKAVGGDVMFVQKSGESGYDDHGVHTQGYQDILLDNPYAGTDDSAYHNVEHTLQQGHTDHFVVDGGIWYVGGKGL